MLELLHVLILWNTSCKIKGKEIKAKKGVKS